MRTVLLIDDDVAFRTMLQELLASHGWNVLEAHDGEEGLRVALEHKPDIILCDLLMPRVNGFQFCREVNSRRGALPDTKLVITSGSGYAIDRINALESGADEYLTKPVKPDALFRLLERLAGTRGTQTELFSAPAQMTGKSGETRVKFWGVRGSIASPGPNTVFYGGNTACVEVRADGELIILDAGTGIRELGQSLKKEFGSKPMRMTILVSHTHWDHIQGFPFFAPAYEPINKVRILAFEGPRKGLEQTLSIQMESPYFPISMQEMPGNIEFEELKSMEFDIGAVHVKAAFMNHPGVCAGFRLFTSAGSVAYFPDNELYGRFRAELGVSKTGDTARFARERDKRFLEFIQGSDIVISDAQYDSHEYPKHVGWGHSCVDDVVSLGLDAGVKQLFLFHHDPDHSDEHVAHMLASARKQVAQTDSNMIVEAAREGMEVVLKAQA
jgi:phosphoribosyl 1,2-cyclic phosphodiesterase/ActR/RegA family two-component response regulator